MRAAECSRRWSAGSRAAMGPLRPEGASYPLVHSSYEVVPLMIPDAMAIQSPRPVAPHAASVRSLRFLVPTMPCRATLTAYRVSSSIRTRSIKLESPRPCGNN